jgi:maltose/moltooligosaccharide transporter
MRSDSPFSFTRIWVLGFGFLGISLLWAIYDDLVPIFLQAGRPDFSKGVGVDGFGLSASQTGLIMGLDNFAALFILPYIGGLSDRMRTRWGRRKPFIAVGAPIAAVAFAVAPLMLGKPIIFFMAALIITLLAMDIFRTPVVALMPDLTPLKFRSQSNGIINFMGGMGGYIAGIVGGQLFGLSPIAPFLLGAGGMLVAQSILLLSVREPVQAEAPEELETASLGVIPSFIAVVRNRDRSTLLLLGAISCWFLGQNAFGTWFTSYAVQQFELKAGDAVTLKTWFTLSALLSSLPSGLVGAKIGRRQAILIGLVLFAFAIAAGYFVPTSDWMKPFLILGGFGWMLVVVNSLPLVLDFAPPERAGTYTGLYYLASQTASFMSPAISGWVFEHLGNNYRLVCLYSPIALVMAFILLLGVQRKQPQTVRDVPEGPNR